MVPEKALRGMLDGATALLCLALLGLGCTARDPASGGPTVTSGAGGGFGDDGGADVNGGPQPCSGSNCLLWLRDISATGVLSWVDVRDIAVSHSGQAFIAGQFEGTLYYGKQSLFPVGDDRRGYLLKISDKLEWAQIFDGPYVDALNAVAPGPDGSVFVGGAANYPGRSDDRAALSDVLVARYASDGKLAWKKTFGNPTITIVNEASEFVTNIEASSDDRIVVTGRSVGPAQADTVSIDGPGQFLLVMKAADGIAQWAKSFPHPNGFARAAFAGTSIVAAHGSGQFDDARVDITVSKYASDGAPEWEVKPFTGMLHPVNALWVNQGQIVMFGAEFSVHGTGLSYEGSFGLWLDQATGATKRIEHFADVDIMDAAPSSDGGYLFSGLYPGQTFRLRGVAASATRDEGHNSYVVGLDANLQGRWAVAGGGRWSSPISTLVAATQGGRVLVTGEMGTTTVFQPDPDFSVLGQGIGGSMFAFVFALDPSGKSTGPEPEPGPGDPCSRQICPGHPGAACKVASDCTIGTCSGVGRGACTVKCATDTDCYFGTRCIAEACTRICTTTAECADMGTGATCVQVSGSGGYCKLQTFANGAPCEDKSWCTSGGCIDSECIPIALSDGAACKYAEQCTSKSCCHQTSLDDVPKCRASASCPGLTGAPCFSNTDCVLPNTCVEGAYSGTGFCSRSCSTDQECGTNQFGTTNYCLMNNGGTKLCYPGCATAEACRTRYGSDMKCLGPSPTVCSP